MISSVVLIRFSDSLCTCGIKITWDLTTGVALGSGVLKPRIFFPTVHLLNFFKKNFLKSHLTYFDENLRPSAFFKAIRMSSSLEKVSLSYGETTQSCR